MSAVGATGNNLNVKVISKNKGIMFGPFRRQSFNLMSHVLEYYQIQFLI